MGGRIHNLEPDFGAIITPGLELAFEESVAIRIDGTTLDGQQAVRDVPVCGPAAFVVLTALAFGDRAEPKDAFDLTYVLRHAPGGRSAVVEQLRAHAVDHAEIVGQAFDKLVRDFATVDGIGPRRAAEFEHLDPEDRDAAAADAHGYIDDLLRSYGT